LLLCRRTPKFDVGDQKEDDAFPLTDCGSASKKESKMQERNQDDGIVFALVVFVILLV